MRFDIFDRIVLCIGIKNIDCVQAVQALHAPVGAFSYIHVNP